MAIILGPKKLEEEKKNNIEELQKRIDTLKNITLKNYFEYKERQDKENFEKTKKDKIMDENMIIIENQFKKLENLMKKDKKIKYELEDEDTNIED